MARTAIIIYHIIVAELKELRKITTIELENSYTLYGRVPLQLL